jgi:hypothetical protein
MRGIPMRTISITDEGPHILSGWKDIANYLGKGVRTVQRYEGELRLPVRRPARKARGSVVATKAELDAWVAASPIREQFQLRVASDPQYSRSMAAVKQGIEEMRALREQMSTLRADLRGSLQSLQHSVTALCQHMEQEGSRSAPIYDIVESGSSRGWNVLELLSGTGNQRKAS